MVIMKPPGKAKYVRLVLKGAPELVLPLCTKIINANGEEEIFKADEKDRILKTVIME